MMPPQQTMSTRTAPIADAEPRLAPGSRREAMLSRRRFLAGASTAVVAGLVADALLIEPRRVVVTRHTVGPLTGAARVRPFRIVQISDLHLQSVSGHEERIAETTTALAPDLIAITGDAIDRAARIDALEAFLDLLELRTPKLAILGNWEHWSGVDLGALERLYLRNGCRLLVNRSVRLTHEGQPILVTGLDDFVGGTPDLRRALVGQPLTTNHLLLAHCPEQRDHLAATPVRSPVPLGPGLTRPPAAGLLRPRLMLSGHTHGGQVTLGGWAPFRPRGSGRFVAGWYREAGTAMYVSRGLGTSVFPARFCASPELVVFDWTLAAG